MKTDSKIDRKIRQFVLQWGQEGMFDKIFDAQLRGLINECANAYASERIKELILTDEQIDRESGKVFPYSDYEWNKVTELRKAFFEAAKWYRNKIQEKI